MSIFSAENVVVSGGGSSSPGRVTEWASNVTYSDGQIVTFNGSQYIARGGVGAGVVPPVEVATPLLPGAPRWVLSARGRSLPSVYNDNTTYYADQVVTFLGGVYILDAPTVPVGTRPTRDKRWTRMSEVLTDAESEKVSSADLSGFAATVTAAIVNNTDEDPRVRHHRVRLTISAISTPGPLYSLRFPRPLASEARPQISVHVEDQIGFYMLLTAAPIISGGQVTGYTLSAQGGAPPTTLEFTVFVKEMVDQVR
jgi:hypothetical protein